MNKPVLLALACSAVAGSAFAQTSSVTLYGVADAAVRQVKNGSAGTVKGVASGANTTSRLGVRGVEQLGGGLSAGFHLESGIELDTGASNASKFWNRRSTVSLMGDFGEIRLGRDTTPTYNNALNDEFGIVGVGSRGVFVYGSSAALGSGATTTQRSDNGVSYFLPKNLGVVAVLIPSTIMGLSIGTAVIFHEGSTLLVVFNALRLLAYKPFDKSAKAAEPGSESEKKA